VFNPDQARAFYDRFGRMQDQQAFYEDRALNDMIAHADFPSAQAVFELGCGTGRLAEQLLSDQLPASASYLGVDVSSTMIELASARVMKFADRARVVLVNGSPTIAAADCEYDRFLSSFVLDLMPAENIKAVLMEARRVLQPAGQLALVGLCHGFNRGTRLVDGVWSWLARHRPGWVGGCRPIDLTEFVREPDWSIVYHQRLSSFLVPMEVLVALRV
jgi:ubiquinone/menaquinone biosynthesis C-methylase UbiE